MTYEYAVSSKTLNEMQTWGTDVVTLCLASVLPVIRAVSRLSLKVFFSSEILENTLKRSFVKQFGNLAILEGVTKKMNKCAS